MLITDEGGECVDHPIVDAEGATFWVFASLFGVLMVFAIVGLSATVYYVLRG